MTNKKNYEIILTPDQINPYTHILKSAIYSIRDLDALGIFTYLCSRQRTNISFESLQNHFNLEKEFLMEKLEILENLGLIGDE